MTILSRFIGRLYKLPPAETHDISIEKGLEISMLDGVILRADRYYVKDAINQPTLLVRTPYGRSKLGVIWGYVFAERGFQVVIQSCRGTDDSEGQISPFRGEGQDGLATIQWLKAQAWFDGRLGMAGPSYMGYTQWAVAKHAGESLKAFSTQVTTSEFYSAIRPSGSLSLEIFLQWIQITNSFNSSAFHYFKSALDMKKRMKLATEHLPLMDADEIVVNKKLSYWSDWLEHTENDAWWKPEDFSDTVSEIKAPNHLISGWYDFLVVQLLRDYNALVEAGNKPYLTIGPWAHSSNGLAETGLRESLQWLRAHILGEEDKLRKSPVRVFVMGADEWREMEAWPPKDTQKMEWYLHTGKQLKTELPPDSEPSQYTFNPAEPTPNVGGATNATFAKGAGALDNRKLEARDDVLTFTTPSLDEAVELMGTVSARIFVSSSLGFTDFFVRLCDVYPSGKSMNICDGLIRLTPEAYSPMENGVLELEIQLSPTAYQFKKGHSIRLQISSGAHPRFARNLGTGEAIAKATLLKVAEQRVYHDSEHPSALILPRIIA